MSGFLVPLLRDTAEPDLQDTVFSATRSPGVYECAKGVSFCMFDRVSAYLSFTRSYMMHSPKSLESGMHLCLDMIFNPPSSRFRA